FSSHLLEYPNFWISRYCCVCRIMLLRGIPYGTGQSPKAPRSWLNRMQGYSAGSKIRINRCLFYRTCDRESRIIEKQSLNDNVTRAKLRRREEATMSQGKSIRVMVVDDHAVVRSGLKAFLMVFDD